MIHYVVSRFVVLILRRETSQERRSWSTRKICLLFKGLQWNSRWRYNGCCFKNTSILPSQV